MGKISGKVRSWYRHRAGDTVTESATTDGGVAVVGDVTEGHVDPLGYLWMNRDVALAAPRPDDAEFALRHAMRHGVHEHRSQLLTTSFPRIEAARAVKFAALLDRSPGSAALLEPRREMICGRLIETLGVRGDSRLPVPFEQVSANPYDGGTEAWMDENPGSMYLDLGAGLRSVYRSNVVYVEIASLPTTDVLAFGDALPFDDGTFDGVVCLAVLEHVPNPFAVAEEMVRVVRPGGRLVVDWPFLQPVHGYPNHYFNATEQGARSAFERIADVATVESYVPLWMHPAFTLRWFLDEWLHRLPEAAGSAFQDLTVREILAHDTASLLQREWSTQLPPDDQAAISAGTRITVVKKG
jgi:Methyltransferase domain